MRTRFAPSPTGYLHLGHVVNAIHVWEAARAAGGRVLLRMEDHDRIRCRPEYEAAILEDLAWLGFEPDEGLRPLVRQSDRVHLYAAALEGLRATQHVYACDCSRKQMAAERYNGHCRHRGLSDAPGRGLRVRIEPGPERFEDLRLGTIEQTPADQCGDLLLRDRDGHWTYQFAVTVDDMLQDITHVIRGADLLESTGRQLRLARMLGRTDMPVFLHHPLIVNPDGAKLSKRSADTGIRDLRDSRMTAAEVIALASERGGLA
jgi:glutamyl-tRNA synthetase/glutamyl-Q tRNA(Asp) synthetase